MRQMKSSGIEWIGAVPVTWEIHPIYFYFSERKNKNIFGTEHNLLSLSYGHVIRKNINTVGGLLPESFNTYNIVEANDIIIRPTDLQNDKRSLRTGLCKEHGIITSAYIALKPLADVNVSYVHYLLHTYDIMKVFYNMGNGVRQGLNYSEFSKLMLFLPPIAEQISIAEFLDKECSELNSLISDIQSQIEALEEYKRSVITEAVTKGLDPDVEMRNSGVQWIGDMPAHWSTMPNKYVMRKVKKICPKYNGEQILSLTMNGVIIRDLDAGGKMPTTFDGYQYVEPDNLLMCLFDIDVTPRCIGLIKDFGLTSPAYSQFIMSDNAFAPYYVYYYTMIDNDKTLLHLAKNLRHSLTEEQLGAISVIVPPYEEQKEIADYLDSKIAEIDSIIALKKQQIETIEEYKKSLIFEYVTGKKEVQA